MEAKDYLEYIVHQIHTTIVATVDEDGNPITCAIDMMDCDDNNLYFLTARGKSLYSRLSSTGKIALTAIKGKDTMHSVSVSIRGIVREIGQNKLPDLFDKNPYMNEIYPSEASRQVLTVFQIYQGNGEWFDLSKKPIERAAFSFGGAIEQKEGFFIQPELCIGCGRCIPVCPQQCIRKENGKAIIQQNNCLHCGRCRDICPAGAVRQIG